MEQLWHRPEEDRLLLCSVRVRRDLSAPLKLGQKVEFVEQLLGDEELIEQFRLKLQQYGGSGYSSEDAGLYRIAPGFFVERTVLREIDESSPILRSSSFRDGEPPGSVGEIRYVLDAGWITPVSATTRTQVLRQLLGLSTKRCSA